MTRLPWATRLGALALTILLSVGGAAADTSSLPPVVDPVLTQPLEPILTPVTKTIKGLRSLLTNSREMKLLVITADGTEPSFSAIRSILDQLGVPYDPVILTQTGGKLPRLERFLKGNYQGIILATGNLVTCSTTPCSIALPDSGWKELDEYAVQYGVRTLAYYTFPDPRYGITWSGTAQVGGTASFLPASAQAFPDLNRSNPISIKDAYLYTASPSPGSGETTTPILSMDGYSLGALHRKADGREYLSLTFDNSPYLTHSIAFGYGLVNWVTKGLFIGSRKFYFSPQIDDLLLASDLYDATDANCRPSGFQLDPTVDPSASCPSIRTTGEDLDLIKSWQDTASSQSNGRIKVTMAYNGFGITPEAGPPVPDSLASASTRHRSSFFWVTHTYDHENLDCFQPVPNSGACTPATYAESDMELKLNANIGRQLGLVEDRKSIVTPNLSGLTNPNFLAAAANNGIRYLVSDSSQLGPDFPHNTAAWSPLRSSLLLIPRRPTNIFYNVYTPEVGVPGSATGEYNYFYGPNGISRVGGPGGPPFFNVDQTYEQIVDREAELIVRNMLRGEVFPLMFHQANLVAYDGEHSLFTDLGNAVLSKLRSFSALPVTSLDQSSIAEITLDRMEFNKSGVSGTLNPGVSIVLTASRSAKIPITGLCRSNCDANGGQPISYYNTNWLLPTVVLVP